MVSKKVNFQKGKCPLLWIQFNLLPTHIGGLLRDGKVTVKVLETNDKWFGVTYQEDKSAVVESIRGLIESGVYAEDLYSDL
ncbi:MAG: hypothetical protein LUH55_06305 [Bacteroides thetaiotaomicron]|nr:hypothetical protein [Bacteroides thetaiotaomicron]